MKRTKVEIGLAVLKRVDRMYADILHVLGNSFTNAGGL